MCDERTLSCSPAFGWPKRSQTKACCSDLDSKRHRNYSETYSSAPPTYSKYRCDVSMYNGSPSKSFLREQAYFEREEKQKPNYYDYMFENNCYDVDRPSKSRSKENICTSSSPQVVLPKTGVKSPSYSNKCQVAACKAKSRSKSKAKRSKSKSQCNEHILGECRALEKGMEDPLGLGPELIEELTQYVDGMKVGGMDKEFVYSLVSMASNSKFLFDGANLIRVQPQGTVRTLFGTNPFLYTKIKKFVREKWANKSSQSSSWYEEELSARCNDFC